MLHEHARMCEVEGEVLYKKLECSVILTTLTYSYTSTVWTVK